MGIGVRSFLKRWARDFARDDGVAGLVIAMIIAIVATTALTVFFSRYSGPSRDLARLQATNESQERLLAAMLSSYYAQSTSPRRIPCPDTDFDGNGEATCGSSGTATGTLPWKDLQISQDDARDGYGRYYTYVVAAAQTAREMCLSVTNDYTSTREYTGQLVETTALELRTTSQSAGQGRYVPYAVISHGANGYGARVSGSVTISTSGAGASEIVNATNSTATAISGPFVSGDSGFDDVVFAPTNADLLDACEELTPAQVVNGTLSEDFQDTSATIDSTKFDTSSSSPPTKVTTNGDGTAQFTNSSSYLATTTSYDFTPTVRPVYVRARWTPTTGVTNAGFSIATRATPPPSANDDFSIGVTFRFDDRDGSTSSAVGVNNNITVRESGAGTPAATSATTYSLINGEEYELEVYDNGDDVWARITQVDNPSNTTTVSYSFAAATDLTGDQRVIFINGSAQSNLDDIVIGVPMLAAEFNGTSSIASSAAATNSVGSDTSLTVEAWIYPDAYPTTGNASVIAARWDTADEGTPANVAYRLYLNAGEVHLRVAGHDDDTGTDIVRTYDSGFAPDLNEWTHVAAVFDASSKTVQFYKDGALFSTHTSEIDDGVSDNDAQLFTVGAEQNNGTNGDFFDGRLSDVRVWDVARTQNQIRTCYNTRVPSTSCTTADMVVNWRFDPTPSQGGIAAGATVAAADGDAGAAANVTYGGALALYFRALSTEFCPSGTKVGAYRCDFRSAGTSSVTIPSNIPAFYAKVWGAGGGGYDVGSNESLGGGGGFSGGLIERISGTTVAGTLLDIIVGEGGTGSTTSTNGAGGGGASGLQLPAPGVGLSAGGGGGASFYNADNGDGGAGGGAGSNPSDAADTGTNCGGRGGNVTTPGANPPNGSDCDGGGADGSGTTGGTGGGTALGGTSGFGTDNDLGGGGRGYDVASRIGAGGGGGGVSNVGATTGGGEAGGHRTDTSRGWGGGGGAGFSNADLANNTSATGGTSGFVDITRTGTFSSGSRLVTGISPSLANSPIWVAGCIIEADQIGTSNDNVIASVDSTSQITLQDDPTGSGTPHTESLEVTCAAVSSTSAGTSDDYYNTTGATQDPGQGGEAGDIDGHDGAVVLLW